MQSLGNSTAWFPHYQWGAETDNVIDLQFSEFDAQAERLAGHDQEYLQLTDGPFHGRFLSCYLGDISLHLECANQALSQSIAASKNMYSIGVVLSGEAPFRVDGIEIDTTSFFVVPPHTSFHLYSPTNGAIMACVIARPVLEAAIENMPSVQQVFLENGAQVRCFRSPQASDRMRQDAMNALCASNLKADADVSPEFLGHALLHSFLTCLYLEFAAQPNLVTAGASKGFKRFAAIRALIEARSPALSESLDAISQQSGMSKRTLQYAFSSEVSLGVTAYLRHTRLRAVRRKLLDPESRRISIGDVAAQYGYWSWSHFSQQYHKHFGERPSETRDRLPPIV